MRVESCLKKNVDEIPKQEVVKIKNAVELLTEDLKEELSTGEMCFLSEGIASNSIPQPQLLVKDHKERNKEGNFLTRLVILATNFKAFFSKMGYMNTQKVLDDASVNYNKHTITQSSDLREKLEGLELTKGKAVSMSLDIENMYPSMRVKLIKKALCSRYN
eukprot:7726286-Ditylum_brightwellii.AAC.1